ncbi:cupin domain-containing protein [Rhodococcus sp. NPDC060176]|uniref:cupin domain-containing protein n=1 Tax=Rhodococcus sp. NPDC060176 TaxID=3347062 RepID=UPI003667BA6B
MTSHHILGNALSAKIDRNVDEGNHKVEGTVAFPDVGGAQVGVWEVEPASWSSIGNDEIFVVLAGRGRVDFTRTGEVADLTPGATVRLYKGEPSVWHITETLRKIYVINPTAEATHEF